MVVDSKSLTVAISKEGDMDQLFLRLGYRCKSVICCRVQPIQKVPFNLKSHYNVIFNLSDTYFTILSTPFLKTIPIPTRIFTSSWKSYHRHKLLRWFAQTRQKYVCRLETEETTFQWFKQHTLELVSLGKKECRLPEPQIMPYNNLDILFDIQKIFTWLNNRYL